MNNCDKAADKIEGRTLKKAIRKLKDSGLYEKYVKIMKRPISWDTESDDRNDIPPRFEW